MNKGWAYLIPRLSKHLVEVKLYLHVVTQTSQDRGLLVLSSINSPFSFIICLSGRRPSCAAASLLKSFSIMNSRSSRAPWNLMARSDGHQRFNSFIQLDSVDFGTQIKWGPWIRRYSQWYAKIDIDCNVFPVKRNGNKWESRLQWLQHHFFIS